MNNCDRTELGNAFLLQEHFNGKLKYDHPYKRWIGWDREQSRWFEDETGFVRMLAAKSATIREEQALEMLKNADREDNPEARKNLKKAAMQELKWALRSKNRTNIDNTLELAASLPKIAWDKEWDTDPDIFHVSNGIIDLKTGEIKQATPDDPVLKVSPVMFDKDSTADNWKQFLMDVFKGDLEIIKYVQKAVGYTLSGSCKEQCLFACYGNGANGKSTFLGALTHIFGDYWSEMKSSALEKFDRVLGEGSRLPGARFAKCEEVGDDVPLNSGRLKSWTGENEMVVRLLFKGDINFTPTHKIWLTFNNLPVVEDGTDAIWRRIKLIPFENQFGVNGRPINRDLPKQLKAEAPGILNWALKGIKMWAEEGLTTPKRLEEMLRSYKEESNNLEAFFAECCEFGANKEVLAASLKHAYNTWCIDNNYKAVGDNKYSAGLRAKKCSPNRKYENGVRTRLWKGIGQLVVPHKKPLQNAEMAPLSVN